MGKLVIKGIRITLDNMKFDVEYSLVSLCGSFLRKV